MRILITGVAGFIGSNLADSLIKNNYDVIGIDNLSYGSLTQVPDEVDFMNLILEIKTLLVCLIM